MYDFSSFNLFTAKDEFDKKKTKRLKNPEPPDET